MFSFSAVCLPVYHENQVEMCLGLEFLTSGFYSCSIKPCINVTAEARNVLIFPLLLSDLFLLDICGSASPSLGYSRCG